MKKSEKKKSPQRYFSKKNVLTLFFIRILLFTILVFPVHPVTAQNSKYFISNTKKINVENFDKAVEQGIRDIGIPGVSLAIIEDDRVVYTNSYGYKNNIEKNKVDQSTLFETCSLSKIYLVFVVYKLVDQGLLNLDKPLYEYLPNERLEHDPRYKLITPRMVVSHTSGLENWEWFNQRGLLEIIKSPGTEFTYSGEGFHYLADVVQQLVNQPYSTYVCDMVLQPLKLKKIDFNYTESDSTGNYAIGHNMMGEPFKKWTTPEPWPASTVHTTADSFAELIIGTFNEKHLTQKSKNEILTTVALINENQHSRYYVGNGFFILKNGNDTIINFAGDNTGFKADMFYSPSSKRGFVFFSNSDLGSLMGPLLNDLTTNFEADLYFNSSYFKGVKLISDALKTYRNEGQEQMISEINSKKKEELDLFMLERLMYDFYFKKIDFVAEELAKVIIKHDAEVSHAYFVMGEVSLRTHKDKKQAKDYFLKAKEYNFPRFNIEDYLKKCEESEIDK